MREPGKNRMVRTLRILIKGIREVRNGYDRQGS